MTPKLKLATILAVVWIVVEIVILAPQISGRVKPDSQPDMISFWVTGHDVLHGLGPSIYDNPHLCRQEHADLFGHADVEYPTGCTLFLYPPSFVPLTVPLGGFGWQTAYTIWTVLGVIAFLLAGWRLAPKTWAGRLTVAAAPGVSITAAIGQNSLFTTSLLAIAAETAERQPILCGLSIGLLSWKPTLAVPLVPFLIAARAWRMIAAACLSAAILAAFSVVLCGPEAWPQWLSTARRGYEMFAQHKITHSWGTTAFSQARMMGLGELQAGILQQVVIVGTLAMAIPFWVKHRACARSIALVCAAIPLTTPFLLFYDLTATLVAVLVLMREKNRPSWMSQAAMAAAWLSPVLGRMIPDLTGSATIIPEISALLFVTCLTMPTDPTDKAERKAPTRRRQRIEGLTIAAGLAFCGIVTAGAAWTQKTVSRQGSAFLYDLEEALHHDSLIENARWNWQKASTAWLPSGGLTTLTDVQASVDGIPGHLAVPLLSIHWRRETGRIVADRVTATYAEWTTKPGPVHEEPETDAISISAPPSVPDGPPTEDRVRFAGVAVTMNPIGPNTPTRKQIRSISIDRVDFWITPANQRRVFGRLSNLTMTATQDGAQVDLTAQGLAGFVGTNNPLNPRVWANRLQIDSARTESVETTIPKLITDPATELPRLAGLLRDSLAEGKAGLPDGTAIRMGEGGFVVRDRKTGVLTVFSAEDLNTASVRKSRNPGYRSFSLETAKTGEEDGPGR